MNKKEFVKKLAEKLENFSIEYAEKLIDTVFETITEDQKMDGEVILWDTYVVRKTKDLTRSDLFMNLGRTSEIKKEGTLLTDFPNPDPIIPSKKTLSTDFPGAAPKIPSKKIK